MAQHAILRFEKHKGNPARPLEAHHERQKEQYASNPDIDTSRSKYNFHIIKPESRYYHFIKSRIEQADKPIRLNSEEDTRFYHCNIKTLNLLLTVMTAQRDKLAGMSETVFHRGEIVTECAHSNVSVLDVYKRQG